MALPPSEFDPKYLLQDLRVGFWLVAITFFLFFAKDFVIRYKNAELKNQRRLFLGIAIFFINYAISRIFFILSDYSYVHVPFPSLSIPIYEDGWEGGFHYQIYWEIGTILGLVGFTVFIFVVEKYLLENKTGLIFTLIGLGLLSVVIVLGRVIYYLVYASLIFMGAVPIILYFYYADLSEGEVRQKSLLCGTSLLILFLGIALDSRFFQNILFPLNIPVKIIGTSLVIIGIIVFNQQYAHYDVK